MLALGKDAGQGRSRPAVHGVFMHVSMKQAWLALAALAFAAVGCTEPPSLENTPQPCDTMSVHQLAGRMRMRVEQSCRSVATLRNAGNRITVFSDPEGVVLVNGRPVGEPGGIIAVGDEIFIPLCLEPQIAAAMRSCDPGGLYVVPPVPGPVHPSGSIRKCVLLFPRSSGMQMGIRSIGSGRVM